ncbi:hypothetical protein [Virgisporangium aurantiacum]|uniref:Uncharacterized protein n=1 Tax=Virgisporangium aurantiacum TaxID=175570 RepID=A0A8J3ZAY2_9ACTN|nr:hypothetical protein [Virgisporangium aurantiacum]GIJ60784.1 hypothetical protein Vau01_083000 [Virgisporangium aurantiacum]
MHARIPFAVAAVTATVPVTGFVALCAGATAADGNIGLYRMDHGLPVTVGPDRWALATVGYAGGVVLSLVVVGLMWNPGRNRRALTVALLAGIALGLLLTLDGLLNIAPNDDLAGVVPSWYAPLSAAQGLLVTALCGLAVIGLPSRSRSS